MDNKWIGGLRIYRRLPWIYAMYVVNDFRHDYLMAFAIAPVSGWVLHGCQSDGEAARGQFL
jgi:hypothetical protein